MTPALHVENITRFFPKFKLGPVSLDVAPGTIMGLVGPNGAGKTTLLRAISSLSRPDFGSVLINGQVNNRNHVGWKKTTGFMLEPVFFENLSVKKNLDFVATFYPTWDNIYRDQLINSFDLDQTKIAKTLSKGQRIIFALIAAMAFKPGLLILDEATAGLDPIVRSEVIDQLQTLRNQHGTAILMSTHLIADVAALADNIAFIENGKIKLVAEKDDLLAKWRKVSFRFDGLFPKETANVISVEQSQNMHLVITDNYLKLNALLKAQGITPEVVSNMELDEICVRLLRRS